MKITIVTVCFDSAETIADTLGSVAAQTQPDIEHLIIDGGSRDATMEIVRQCGSHVARCVSEPDHGIYDAMNKGLSLVTGDVVGILNSDDVYADEGVLARVAQAFSDPTIDCVFGDLTYVDSVDMSIVKRFWRSSPYVPGAFQKGWHPPHPTFFARRSVYEECGGFDIAMNVSADFEIMLRILERYRRRSRYIPHVLVKMRVGGVSNRSLGNIARGNINILRAFRRNGVPVNPVAYPIRRLLPKLVNLLRHRFQ